MASDLSYLARAKAAPKYYAGGLYREISEKNVFLFAQAIAFKVLVTIMPVLVLATGMLSSRLGDQTFEEIASLLRDFLPSYQSDQLLAFLNQMLAASGTITLVGAIGLFLTAMTLFTTLRLSIGSAFEQEWHTQRTILGGYAFDLRMVVQVGVLFLLSIALSLFGQWLMAGDVNLLQRLGLDYAWAKAGRRGIVQLMSFLLPLLVTTLMFFQLFYFIPKPHPPKRSALVGAGVTALLWEMAKTGFTYYAQYVAHFDRYGGSGTITGEEGMAALGTTFGLLIAFVFWVYYSGIVLILGAIVASLHERHRRLRHADAKAAPRESAPASKLDAAAREHPAQNDPATDDSSENASSENGVEKEAAAQSAPPPMPAPPPQNTPSTPRDRPASDAEAPRSPREASAEPAAPLDDQ